MYTILYLLNNTADYKNKLLKQLHETGGSEQSVTDRCHDELLNKIHMIHCSGTQSKHHALKVQGARINNLEVRPDSFVRTTDKQRYYLYYVDRMLDISMGPLNSLAIHGISMLTYFYCRFVVSHEE